MRLPWRLVLGVVVSALACATAAKDGSTAETTAECLRDNVPSAWAGLFEVHVRQADGATEQRRMAYATRERGRKQATSEHWVRMLAPDNLAGVVHLFRHDASGGSRWSYLPALERVRRVNSQGGDASAALEEIVGVAELDAMLRWSEGATIQFAAPREEGGRRVRPINATRKVTVGGAVGFEKMRGLMDVERCVMLEAEWQDPDGRQTHSARVERASLRQFGRHWLPQRIDVQQGDGVTAQVRLERVVIAPNFGSDTFDASRFHKVTTRQLGLE